MSTTIKLTPSNFEATYASVIGGAVDCSISLRTDNKEFKGVGYQQDGNVAFYIGSQVIEIWADSVDEMTLGSNVLSKNNDFANGQELYALLLPYQDTIKSLV